MFLPVILNQNIENDHTCNLNLDLLNLMQLQIRLRSYDDMLWFTWKENLRLIFQGLSFPVFCQI